ncbi:butyrophilin-like protein 2 [Cricetulus griseus]|uniref:Butyrophilin-like protein 2 n=1 Tax=Cricetulus griseus TaxID=10029 RepID=A0A061IJB2_CRIGR|nr:butyrophilin-like protein 2 [Cricetulus griseus]
MADCPGYSLSGVAASLLFILLTVKHPDEFRVTGPALPVLAKVGEDALLTCQLLPRRTAAHMEVRWYRSDPDAPLIVHRHGAQVAGLQVEGYRGRVEWTEDSADEGSVSLRIRQIHPGDDGQYWCRFQEGDYWGEASVLLQVADAIANKHITSLQRQRHKMNSVMFSSSPFSPSESEEKYGRMLKLKDTEWGTNKEPELS